MNLVLVAAFMFNSLARPCLALTTDPPGIRWVEGYTDGACESHNHAGVQTADGGFLLVGDGECYDQNVTFVRQITVAKVDHAGTREWMTNVGTVGFNYGKNGLELPDGTFLIAGSISEGTVSNYTELRALIRFSAKGEVLNTQTFSSSMAGGLDGLMGLALAGSNIVVATGYVKATEPPESDSPCFLVTGGYAVLMKFTLSNTTDQELKLEFERVFDTPDATSTFIAYQGMRIVADSDFYTISAASYTSLEDFNTNFGLIQTDTDGNIHYMKYLPASDGNMSHPYAFTAASDTGYVIAGHTIRDVDDTPQGRIVKVNSDLDLEFDFSFRQERVGYSTECYGVSICPDGGYIVACGTGPEEDQDSEPWQNLVQRVDNQGNSIWKKIYTGENNRNGTGEYIITDEVYGGYAVYMDTSDWGSGSTGGNFAIMHLEADT